jgi:NADPH-dependent 2,4-dienoyl-CoA reductase/sulfur reductase-like enzyme
VEEFDTIVVGAGPAGIAAACTCADRGSRVLLLDQAFRAGGQIWRHRLRSETGRLARRWISRLSESAVSARYGTSVIAIDSSRTLTLVERDEVFRVCATSLVLATGARELFLPFPGWTLPWVVGAGGAQALLKEGTSFHGKRAVVAGSGPLLLPVAASLAKAGARVTHVLEQTGARAVARFSASLVRGEPMRVLQAAGYAAGFGAWRYRLNSWVESAHGSEHVEEVTATVGGSRRQIPCDVLCTGFGLIPSTELAGMAGCAISKGVVLVDSRQRTSVPGLFAVGEIAGVAGVENAVAQGRNAALAIYGEEAPRTLQNELRRGMRMAHWLAAAFQLRREVLTLADGETIVCRCEDVREKSLDARWSWRELKLRTRMGMGPCQGRVCGAAMQARYGIGPDDSRLPLFPVPLGVLMASTDSENDE